VKRISRASVNCTLESFSSFDRHQKAQILKIQMDQLSSNSKQTKANTASLRSCFSQLKAQASFLN